jgi:fumarate reductase subunit C
MSGKTLYTPHHPKWHRRRMSVWWWLGAWPYTRFILRELTSLFVAVTAIVNIWLARALAKGPDAYEVFLARMASPPFLVLNTVALLFVLFHATTWFNLAPLVKSVRIRGKRVPDAAVTGAFYGLWAVVTALMAMILTGR